MLGLASRASLATQAPSAEPARREALRCAAIGKHEVGGGAIWATDAFRRFPSILFRGADFVRRPESVLALFRSF